MKFIALWFILSGGSGYIAPLDVYPIDPPAGAIGMHCGINGGVVGVTVDRPVNPTTAIWPDPFFPGVHCEVSISEKVATLAPGEYSLATTIMGADVPAPYISHDPHTSDNWTRQLGGVTPPKPTTFRVVKENP